LAENVKNTLEKQKSFCFGMCKHLHMPIFRDIISRSAIKYLIESEEENPFSSCSEFSSTTSKEIDGIYA